MSFSDANDTKNKAAVKIGVVNDITAMPLYYAAERKMIRNNLHFIKNDAFTNELNMLDGVFDISLVPVHTLAKTKDSWLIIKDAAVSAFGKMKTALLFFNKGLVEINSVAVDKNAGVSQLLLQIILQEKFETKPEIIPIQAGLDQKLSECDAALVTGIEAVNSAQNNKNYLDLNEEWSDLTGFPMVYYFWAVRSAVPLTKEIAILRQSMQVGLHNLENIAKEIARENEFSWAVYHDLLAKNINYSFSEEEQAGLKEFYQYAFSYSLLDYIPEIRVTE